MNVFIRSMGPVEENSQRFTFDCYFRQFWTDPRLTFNSTNLAELAMNWQVGKLAKGGLTYSLSSSPGSGGPTHTSSTGKTPTCTRSRCRIGLSGSRPMAGSHIRSG
jgi:hypothetical protein